MQFPIYRWSFETVVLSRIVVEICVKYLAKRMPVENALILIFVFQGSKLGVTVFCNFVLVAAP